MRVDLTPVFPNSENIESITKHINNELTNHHQSLIYFTIAGVAALHGNDPPLCHRDLKPANVMLSDQNSPVLIDFGCVCVCLCVCVCVCVNVPYCVHVNL